ncbi:hypothetical protein PPH41_21165, partial [Burkholderia gladioli]|nr:hypothetical protein [Burkholderia gladioli]
PGKPVHPISEATSARPGTSSPGRDAQFVAAALADRDRLGQIAVGRVTDVVEVGVAPLDGAFSLYLPILKLLEPHLAPGTPLLAENAVERGNAYLDYVRDPANGYLSQPIPISEGRGNELSVATW